MRIRIQLLEHQLQKQEYTGHTMYIAQNDELPLHSSLLLKNEKKLNKNKNLLSSSRVLHNVGVGYGLLRRVANTRVISPLKQKPSAELFYGARYR